MAIVSDVSPVRPGLGDGVRWLRGNPDGSGFAISGIAGMTPPTAADSPEGDPFAGRIDRPAAESA